jgi:hypothetical protein
VVERQSGRKDSEDQTAVTEARKMTPAHPRSNEEDSNKLSRDKNSQILWGNRESSWENGKKKNSPTPEACSFKATVGAIDNLAMAAGASTATARGDRWDNEVGLQIHDPTRYRRRCWRLGKGILTCQRRAQRCDLSNQKLNEVKLFRRQRSALLGHLKTVEHLEGDSQLKLWSEGLDQRRLLNVSSGSGL